MTNNFWEFIEESIGYLLVLSILVDLGLSGTWNRMYFTSGLRLFLRRIPVVLRHSNIPLSSRFNTEFRSTWSSSFAFKEVAPNIYGFREKFFEFRLIRSSPLMHGMLFFDFANSQVVVKGYADWSMLCFSLIWLGIAALIGITQFPESTLIALAFIAFFMLVMGILYWIQYNRFTKVAEFAAQAWARRRVLNESIMDAVKRLGS